MSRSFRFAALLALGLLACTPAETPAHTALISSTPADGSGYADPPQLLELAYSADVRLTAIRLTDQTGAELETDFAIAPESAALFTVALPRLTGGDYTVAWRALSADGHPIEGSLTFSVVNP